MAAPDLLERAEQWLARRWVPVLINVAALALLCYSLAQGTWRLLTPAIAEAPAAAAPTQAPGGPALQALLDADLFGRAPVAAEAEPAVRLDAIPASSLNLTLTGVMVTPRGSFALISAGSGPELPFAIGHEIAPGATLYAVYSDRVLIRRDGATESLMLEDAEQTGGGASPRPARAGAAAGNANRVIQARSGAKFTVDRKQLSAQMQTPEFLTQALMVPNPGGGFLVREIQPGSLYEKLGLRAGDVINTVNGQPVNTVEDVMRLYSQFGSTSNVQVDVQRGGASETLVYNLQ